LFTTADRIILLSRHPATVSQTCRVEEPRCTGPRFERQLTHLSGENLAKLTEKGEPAAVIDTGEWSAPPGVTEDQILSRSWALRNDQRHVVPRKVL
jgi:hypothetical protein